MNDIKLEWHFSKWNNRDGNGYGSGYGDSLGGGYGYGDSLGGGDGWSSRPNSYSLDQGVIA